AAPTILAIFLLQVITLEKPQNYLKLTRKILSIKSSSQNINLALINSYQVRKTPNFQLIFLPNKKNL
ncbi:MAG: hypothetical protein CMH63_03465, partial [Nanoarchaeota archaeon]|nr:hypothetical protein [Nanoarchaeota archaeon]